MASIRQIFVLYILVVALCHCGNSLYLRRRYDRKLYNLRNKLVPLVYWRNFLNTTATGHNANNNIRPFITFDSSEESFESDDLSDLSWSASSEEDFINDYNLYDNDEDVDDRRRGSNGNGYRRPYRPINGHKKLLRDIKLKIKTINIFKNFPYIFVSLQDDDLSNIQKDGRFVYNPYTFVLVPYVKLPRSYLNNGKILPNGLVLPIRYYPIFMPNRYLALIRNYYEFLKQKEGQQYPLDPRHAMTHNQQGLNADQAPESNIDEELNLSDLLKMNPDDLEKEATLPSSDKSKVNDNFMNLFNRNLYRSADDNEGSSITFPDKMENISKDENKVNKNTDNKRMFI